MLTDSEPIKNCATCAHLGLTYENERHLPYCEKFMQYANVAVKENCGLERKFWIQKLKWYKRIF